MIRILAVASEIFPLVKTGGLADVAGALPLALRAHAMKPAARPARTAEPAANAGTARRADQAGTVPPAGRPGVAEPDDQASIAEPVIEQTEHAGSAGADVITMVPGYPAVLEQLTDAVAVHTFPDLFGGPATLLRGAAASLELLVVDAPHLYTRAGQSLSRPGRARNGSTTGCASPASAPAAAAVAAGIVPALAFDIVHAHDWQAAMALVYLNFHNGPRPGTVLTIHNLAFQGRYHAALFPRLGLPDAAFGLDGLEYHGDVSFLKGGLSFADR